MLNWVETLLTRQLVAELSLLGMGFDVLGGCYLAYDLLGGKRGPLRTIARATGYVALFFIGYGIVLGLRYGLVASTGMGVLLAIEFRRALADDSSNQVRRSSVFLFGFLRGVVLGLAGMTMTGPTFGVLFGLLSGIGLTTVYALGFAPMRDYETHSKPRISTHKILASLFRALAISLAGVITAFLTSPAGHWMILGLRLGLAAGTVSALVGLFSPAVEWWIDHLPERRLGVLGLGLILIGMLLQSVQYWVVVFDVPVR